LQSDVTAGPPPSTTLTESLSAVIPVIATVSFHVKRRDFFTTSVAAVRPLPGARRTLGRDAAVVAAANAALRFVKAVCAEKAWRVTATVALSDASAAVIGGELLTYNLFGPAVRAAMGLLDAAPTGPAVPSYAVATEAVRRVVELPSRRTQLSSKDFGPQTGGASLRPSTLRSVAPETPASRQEFGPPVRWRARGLGAVSLFVVLA